MYELRIPNLALPPCVVCESRQDAEIARTSGLPYLIKPKGWTDAKLVGAIMYKMLKRRFPYIKWDKVLGIREKSVDKVIVMDPGDTVTTRETVRGTPDFEDMMDECLGDDIEHEIGGDDGYVFGDDAVGDVVPEVYTEHSLDEFYGNAVEHVNMEQLQELGLLPTFLSDIEQAVRRNIVGTSWMDGWNKKLGTSVGEYKYSEEAPNLIILDVSGSIPYGISFTMLTLIDMLRTQANADLIITGDRSYYYECDRDMPTPEELSSLAGGANEATMFNHILCDRVFGKTWGNVIVFGDMHAPNDRRFIGEFQIDNVERRNTVVNRLMCYDTRGDYIPGYGTWALDHVDDANVEIKGDDWTTYMKNRREMW